VSDYGIKVSFPGTDVKSTGMMTAGTTPLPDFSTQLFSSAFFVYKVLVTGTTSLAIANTAPASSRIDTITIAHGLGYAPMTNLYFSVDGANWFANNAETEGSSTGQPFRSAQIGADATNVVIQVVSSHLAAYTFQARYIIYAEVGI
jgi:hypothetical protein